MPISQIVTNSIAESAVVTVDIADGAVTTAKIADANVTQAKLGTSVAGTGPAFRAFSPSNFVVTTATDVKIPLSTEVFDTASRFNNTGSTVGGIPAYAFLPNVAGYYQINAVIGAQAGTSLTYNYIQIRKNGVNDSIAIYGPYAGNTQYGSTSVLIFLNGTTDFVELFGQLGGTGTLQILGGSQITNFSGSLVRAA